MRVETLTVGMFQSNCYVVYCEEKREALIIDPGDEGARIVGFVKDERLDVKGIVNTHSHIDHVSALAEVREAFDAPVMMHEDDFFIYENLAYQGTLFGLKAPEGIKIDSFLENGENIRFGECRLQVVQTPGHSPGSISLVAPDGKPVKVFAGDTLFKGSIGRTDLYGGNYEQIIDTLRNVFLTLPDDAVVYPGHGEATTIAQEKKHNPFLMNIA